ncbi:MAG: PadR family transcriptional regulator, regulatory protein PadR [Candidatus Eremiobacteraeota bacterium]|jgi:DNA-binding PadR family transcriptional regulator|nr:PadR family transcriptional regulator, regulatory protein PadR [Candidatus Eremiobacteraeota bacterium]
MAARSRAAEAASDDADPPGKVTEWPSELWGDRVFTGEVKTKTVFPALVLQMLHAQPDSGYGLMQRIGSLGGIFPVNPNTIYPLLRRLEERGFIRGELDASTKRGTMLYRITGAGEERLESIKANFKPYLTNLIEAMQRLRRDLYGETS